jgi:uncharacterized coiled-coil DUF342 family protein
MLTNEEKDSLIGELKGNQQEIYDLKKDLNALNTQKEAEYHKREDVGKQISELIRKIKALKEERDTFTNSVKENKQKRDALRTQLHEKITSFKKASEEKKSALGKKNLKNSPERLREEIKHMESKIETDALSFDKEQKMMKAIKELKKELNEMSELDNIFNASRSLSKEIKELKKEIDSCNDNVKNFAGQSQSKHEEMLTLSKQVDELMAQEKEHKENFQKLKEQFVEANGKLKDMLPKMSGLRDKLDGERNESRAKRKEELDKELKEKEDKVKEKMKRGQKLTTEDLLVFQAKGDDEDEPLSE